MRQRGWFTVRWLLVVVVKIGFTKGSNHETREDQMLRWLL